MKNVSVEQLKIEGGGRIIGLDVFRIALALLIFMFHSQIHFKCSYSYANDFVKTGAIAMTGFMLLSGFVLYMSYSKKDFSNITEVKTFYLKRLISILPLYYSIAIIHVAYQTITGNISLADVAILFPVELFSVQSTYFSLFPYSHNSGTWFISCILICYALYPFIQFLISSSSKKFILITLLVISGMLLYAPIVRYYFGLDKLTIYANPFYRLLEFMIGVILAYIVSLGIKAKLLYVLISPFSLLITVFIMIFSISVFRHYFSSNDFMLYNWIALPCFVVIIVNLTLTPLKSIRHSILIQYLSSIAFTFFLCQVLPLWSASKIVYNHFCSDSNLLKILISLAMCLLGAIIIHELIEKPASKYLKTKLLK